MSIYISQDGFCSTNQAEAREHGDFETYETPTTKAAWVAFFNDRYYGAPAPATPDFVKGDGATVDYKIDAETEFRNTQSDFNITAEEQIQNCSFDDAVRLMEQCTGRINEHIRAVMRGEV